jgi:acid stress chaperone HdeB
MRSTMFWSGIMLALAVAPAAQAQVTLDMSKVTCEQFVKYKITSPDNIALWLSGYYHGKHGDPVIDTQTLIANARKLTTFCIRNPQMLVMQALETELSTK